MEGDVKEDFTSGAHFKGERKTKNKNSEVEISNILMKYSQEIKVSVKAHDPQNIQSFNKDSNQ